MPRRRRPARMVREEYALTASTRSRRLRGLPTVERGTLMASRTASCACDNLAGQGLTAGAGPDILGDRWEQFRLLRSQYANTVTCLAIGLSVASWVTPKQVEPAGIDRPDR